jgi:hypothetical protein
MKADKPGQGLVRYTFLVIIIAYGAGIAIMTQVSSPNYQQLAGTVLNCFVVYLLAATGFLWVNRMKDWKPLLIASLVLIGFVFELVARVQ